jgi:DNA invertase Pin-like site-specific DNA recombinase
MKRVVFYTGVSTSSKSKEADAVSFVQNPDSMHLWWMHDVGYFDVIIVWRFDRFARSVKQLVLGLEQFHALGIDFVSHQEALDTSTPMGKAMFTIIAGMAELKRNIIRERVAAGVEYARRNGTRSGKPIGRPKVVFRADHSAAS